jgi:Terpene cyclase DEP1
VAGQRRFPIYGEHMLMSRKLLCVVYAVIALVALVATWSQNLIHIGNGGSFLGFWEATKVNPASRSITVDIALFLLAAAILMVIEARRVGVKFVWAYILGGFLIAISVTFPLFLLARELRLEKSDATQLKNVDSILLAALAGFTLAFTIWVDVV